MMQQLLGIISGRSNSEELRASAGAGPGRESLPVSDGPSIYNNMDVYMKLKHEPLKSSEAKPAKQSWILVVVTVVVALVATALS
mgnify:CR=1 FL=1